MNLPELYRKLLDQYEQVLSVTLSILDELRRGEGEKKLNLLLEKKESLGDEIARLTEQITSSRIGNDSRSDLSTLTEVKGLLRQVTEKARLLGQVEGEIQDFLESKDSGRNSCDDG